jgi:proteic killer suppression protein
MISDFRDDWLREFFLNDLHHRKIPAGREKALFRKLQLIDDANEEKDLRIPPGNHFERLRGNLEGYCCIRVNIQWRLIFRWNAERSEASGLYLDDHSYR